MAEERLIDEDKDRKYRIKVNDDGEEELVVDGEEEQPAVEEVTFEVEELTEDNEEEAVMTPEQLAAKREREEAERAERRRRVEELIKKAESDCKLNKFATALEYLEKAEEIDGEDGEVHALKLIAYTRNFTDYSQVIAAAEGVDDVKEYTSAERKAEMLKKASSSLEANIAESRAKVAKMHEENEGKKAERAVRFLKDRKTAIIIFAVVCALFVTFGVLTAYFGSVIYSVSTGTYLILTCVFGGLSFIALIALAFAARYLNITCRRVRLNKRNTSTQLGRDLLAEQAKLKALIAVYSVLKGE